MFTLASPIAGERLVLAALYTYIWKQYTYVKPNVYSKHHGRALDIAICAHICIQYIYIYVLPIAGERLVLAALVRELGRGAPDAMAGLQADWL